jgi:glyoxalase-like protein
VRGINHFVLTARSLDAISAAYERLGFTLAPRGQHPFGTGNVVIQLHGNYIELLSVTRPQDVPEHSEERFSFAAFNRDYLARHEGFSMTAFGTPDAVADRNAWSAEGLKTYEPVEFSRMAKLPSGEETRIGFVIAFARSPAAPWLGLFTCQHFRPDYYEQPQYQAHANTALTVSDVWISGDGALETVDYVAKLARAAAPKSDGARIIFETPTGALILAEPRAFEDAFGVTSPNGEDGPHLAGLTVKCRDIGYVSNLGLATCGRRHVVSPETAFGTALAFMTA